MPSGRGKGRSLDTIKHTHTYSMLLSVTFSLQEKNRSSEDIKVPGTHPQLGRVASATVTSNKWATQPVPAKRGGANDKYTFPGEMGRFNVLLHDHNS